MGEGSLFTGLSIRKEELKLNNVYFEGGVSDPSIYLMKSKIFISIQSDNNYPSQSLLEAMASENAIVASDVGETRRIVTDKEGILIPLSAKKIVEALKFLFNHSDHCRKIEINED